MKRTDEEKLFISRKDGGLSWPVQIKSQTAKIHYKWCTPWCVVCVLFVAICIIVSASWMQGGAMKVINMELIYFGDRGIGTPAESDTPQCELTSRLQRFNCHPDSQPNKERCEQRGCCWETQSKPGSGVHPSCFFPKNHRGFEIEKELEETDFGFTATLTQRNYSSWLKDVTVKVDLYLETENTIRIKIYDASKVKGKDNVTKRKKKPSGTDYHFTVNPTPFGMKVIRKSSDIVLFDATITDAPLIFAEQFQQISTRIPSGFLYGLDAHNSSLLMNLTYPNEIKMEEFPFFMSQDLSSKVYGVYMASKDVTVDVQPFPALTFRTGGHVLDFYIFTGPTADLVVEQYTSVIGKPQLPPYWALGLQTHSKLASEELRQLVNKTRSAGFPQDVLLIADNSEISSSKNLAGILGDKRYPDQRIFTPSALAKSTASKRNFAISNAVILEGKPTWVSMRQTLTEIITRQINGAALSGTYVCGSMVTAKTSVEELCVRWYQLAAFYPLMRVDESAHPVVFGTRSQTIIRSVLKRRYSLLPYLYTMLYHSNTKGWPILKPLSFQYPSDKSTLAADEQFMFGSALLISPVFYYDQEEIKAYFPRDTWYNYINGSVVSSTGSWMTLPSPLDTINIHQRGGTIVPTQHDALTTGLARKTPFTLNVALKNGEASGSLFLDDGESADTLKKEKYSIIEFSVKNAVLVTKVIKKGYVPEEAIVLEKIRIMGIQQEPRKATVNKKPVQVNFNRICKELTISGLDISLLEVVRVKWNQD